MATQGFDINALLSGAGSILPALIGGMFGPVGGIIGSAFTNAMNTARANEDAEGYRDTVQGAFDQANTAIENATSNLPAFSYGGQVYGERGGKTGSRGGSFAPIDLDSMFTAGQDALDAWNAIGLTPENVQVGTGFVDEGAGRIRGVFDNAYAGIGSLFGNWDSQEDFLRGVDLPDTDLSALLSADLAGIGERSRLAEEQQRQGLASAAAQGPGLEGMLDASRNLSFTMGRDRALAGAGARAENRAQEFEAQKYVSGLQAGANQMAAQMGGQHANLLASLAGQQAGAEQYLTGLEGSVLRDDISNLFNLGSIEANLTGQASNDAIARLGFLTNELNNQAQLHLGGAGQMGNLAGTMAGFYSPMAQTNYLDPGAYLPSLYRNYYNPQPEQGGLFNLGL